MFSPSSIRLLEQTSRALGVYIQHALCGHGGERLIKGTFIYGYSISIPRMFFSTVAQNVSQKTDKKSLPTAKRATNREPQPQPQPQKGPRFCEKQASGSLKNGSVIFRKRSNRWQENARARIRARSF